MSKQWNRELMLWDTLCNQDLLTAEKCRVEDVMTIYSKDYNRDFYSMEVITCKAQGFDCMVDDPDYEIFKLKGITNG